MSEDVVDALYSVPLEQFTKERARVAAEAKSKPERAKIRAVPKPTRAAWTIDKLARDRRKDVEALFGAGDALERAQRKGDRTQIQDATRALRVRLAELTKAARALGANATTAHRITSTLQAALVDDEVRALVLASRLAHDVEVEGFSALAGTKLAAPRAPSPKKKATADREEARAKAREEARASARREREEREAQERRRAIERREHENAVGEARLAVADAEKKLAAAKAKLRALKSRKSS